MLIVPQIEGIATLEAPKPLCTCIELVTSGSAKEKPSQGEVISVGPGKKNDSGEVTPVNLKAGDVVLFGQYAGNEVKLEGEDYLIMSESDIFGVIE